MKKNYNKQVILAVLLVALLIAMVGGVTYAFFNYTRTGVANTLQVGRIAFNSTQNNTITLENVFPTATANLNSSNSDTVTITITGDTTYSEGIEYKVTLEDVNNTINDKEVPISFNVTASNLGTKDTSYYTNRGGENAIYNLTETGQVEDGKYILVGYIPSGEDGVNGSIDITAYIDASNIAISDTVSRIDNGNLVYGETPGDWIAGRTVFTTSEWNSFNSNPLTFKVRVEANEGIWVEEAKYYVLANLNSNSNWTSIRANITSIEFHSDGVAPTNPVTSFDATDITSEGTVTVYTVDDGLGNGTYRAIVVADDTIYAPEDSSMLFMSMSKLTTFNSRNFRVENVTNMVAMFTLCSNLTNVDGLINWNTSNVTNMMGMFYGCSNLVNVDGLINWNTNNVEKMHQMFDICTNLENVNGLINWKTKNVDTIRRMFYKCYSLTDINGLINWDTSSVTDMGWIFSECINLIDFSALSEWDTSNVTNMGMMFAMDINPIKINNSIIDFSPLANWNVSNVTIMGAMFENVNVASYIPFMNWNVGKVNNFSAMFNTTSASMITNLKGLEKWNVSSATDMSKMFQDNVSLNDASAINNWNIKASIDFTQMFANTPVHPEFTRVPGTWDANGTFTPNA